MNKIHVFSKLLQYGVWILNSKRLCNANGQMEMSEINPFFVDNILREKRIFRHSKIRFLQLTAPEMLLRVSCTMAWIPTVKHPSVFHSITLKIYTTFRVWGTAVETGRINIGCVV